MKESLIYSDVSELIQNSTIYQNVYDKLLKEIPEEYNQTIYIFQKPLLVSEEKEYYELGVTFVIQNTNIFSINCSDLSENKGAFEDYCDDLIDDINSLASEKYPQYYKLLGRKRYWSGLFKSYDYNEIDDISFLNISNKTDSRKIEVLSSLIIGSINDFENYDTDIFEKEEITVLEAVKNKITLFDTNQTKFVYKELDDKSIIRLQGLAGSGKTELLLHKIRKKFVDEPESRIGVTCYNKVLADSLASRIIDFFNTMKVTEQITTKRLFVGHSWGSRGRANSGLYAKICFEYGIDFKPFSYSVDPSEIWREAIEFLKKRDFEPIFDYLFIDEGQDFDHEYIELCEMITAKKVYVAGDILQDIFSKNSVIDVNDTDYVLNKVYRTDPRTILFSHILGFGLLEETAVRWLKEDEWEMSGYDITLEQLPDRYMLSRQNIRRFEDSDLLEDISSVEIVKVDQCNSESVINIIKKLKNQNKDLLPRDLAIIFTNYSEKTTKRLALEIAHEIIENFQWDYVLVPRDKRVQIGNEVTITNINNVKGLEFPFVIIIDNQGIKPITSENSTIEIRKRNALYMSLTRSFITSYLVLSKNNMSEDYIDKLNEVSQKLKSDGAKLLVEKPKKIIKESQLYGVDSKLIRTQEDIIVECLNEENVDSKFRSDVIDIVSKTNDIKNGTTDKDIIKKKIRDAIDIIKG